MRANDASMCVALSNKPIALDVAKNDATMRKPKPEKIRKSTRVESARPGYLAKQACVKPMFPTKRPVTTRIFRARLMRRIGIFVFARVG